MSGELPLDLYGAEATVTCADASVLEALRRDFEYFAAPSRAAAPELKLALELRAPGADGDGGTALFRARDYRVGTRGSERLIRYDDGALAVHDYAARSGRIYSPDPARLHELAYLAVLSRLGERLDRLGLHRVHALGFEWAGQGGLLLLPSGGGKSTLAVELLKTTDAGLLSDDSPLVDSETRLLAFPLRLGLRPDADLSSIPEEYRRPFQRRRYGPKIAVALDFFRARVRSDIPLRWLVVGKRGAGPAGLRPLSRARAAAALALDLVVGRGLAQMSEYMIRPTPSGVADLAAIAASRARAAGRIIRTAEPWEFFLGDDPRGAARVLAEFLKLAPERELTPE